MIASSVRAALWPSPWAAEDGGPRRSQEARDLYVRPGERLICSAVRDAFATTMIVLRDPGEVFALRHSLGSNPLRDPSEAWVERIDPETLEPLASSPPLAAGPFWPGGLAAHANGSLYVVYGRYCHRLSASLDLLGSFELPAPRPYNSFVVLGDGTLAMKDIDRSLSSRSTLTLLDPESLERRCSDVLVPESVIGRLSADEDRLFVVGVRSVYAYRWDGASLSLEWSVPYVRDGYGWDPVIEGGQLWFLDQGEHRYATTMLGAEVGSEAVRLIRIALDDPSDVEAVSVCGLPRGAVTDPPLYDPVRRIAVGYDSANGVVAAFRFGERLEPLWRRELAHAAHMLRLPESGQIVVHDSHGPRLARTRLAQAVGGRAGFLAGSARVRRAIARRYGDDVVVLDIESGAERARARVPSMFQSVLFPAPGWNRDLYWCTFSTIARLEVR
jgi:hypothetical protein